MEPLQTTLKVPPRARARRVLLIGGLFVAVAALVLLMGSRGTLEQLAAAACRGDRPAASRLRWIVTATLVTVPLSAVAIAAYVFATAEKIWRAREFPPPGMLVWRPVAKVRGQRARTVAALFAALGGLLAVAGIALLLLSLRMLQLLSRNL